jgi:uroporphyrinogen-III synthase
VSGLAGRRIVVTRAAAQAQPLVDRLLELGAEPVVVPLIEIVEPSDGGQALANALARLGEFDWIVVTSPNGAERVRSALAASPTRPMVAAVGTATAAALGVPVDLVPDVQTADGLAGAFGHGAGAALIVGPEQRRADRGRQSPVHRALAAQGWTVTAVEAYRTVPIAPSSGDLLRVLSADAVLFASGSAVRGWVDVFGTQTPAVTAAIGPSTAQVAGENGLKIDIIATDHSLHGLVDSLLVYFDDAV